MRLLRFALIGHPVSHSASPAMHTAAFKAMGLPHTYEAVSCESAVAAEAAIGLVRRGGVAGLNVTVPHKRAVLSWVDEVDETARSAGAANVIARSVTGKIVAHNTDTAALVAELTQLCPQIRTALIVGSGGAAAAALEACKQLGARVIGVTSRSWVDSETLYESETATAFRARGAFTVPWPPLVRDVDAHTKMSMAMQFQWGDMATMADVVIQATSAGMSGGAPGDEVASLVPFAKMQPTAAVLDVVYGPTPTPFIEQARRRGLAAADGVGMLVRQGALSQKLWLGVDPPEDIMRAAVRKHLLLALRP